jgi:hypothetical protein
LLFLQGVLVRGRTIDGGHAPQSIVRWLTASIAFCALASAGSLIFITSYLHRLTSTCSVTLVVGVGGSDCVCEFHESFAYPTQKLFVAPITVQEAA